jgi:hypothetical protein
LSEKLPPTRGEVVEFVGERGKASRKFTDAVGFEAREVGEDRGMTGAGFDERLGQLFARVLGTLGQPRLVLDARVAAAVHAELNRHLLVGSAALPHR